jgi:hypothetical protein
METNAPPIEALHTPPAVRAALTRTKQILPDSRDQACRVPKHRTQPINPSRDRDREQKRPKHNKSSPTIETDVPRAEALHDHHRWFTELQPAHDRARPWIRILRLEAGAFGDPLHGRLTVEELDETEPFDALSYCCGPPILSCTITVNYTPGFRITQNLWNALQRVRKKDEDRRLWVDAVCIDQDDEREKSSQVRRMHTVYSRAEEVCIYFGECAEQTLKKREDPFGNTTRPEYHWTNAVGDDEDESFFKPVHSVRELQKSAANSYKSSKEGRWAQEGEPFDDNFMTAMEGNLLSDLTPGTSRQHLWWNRLWTVQELLLARKPVVYCGPYTILWSNMIRLWIRPYSSPGAHILRKNFPRATLRMREETIWLHWLRGRTERNLHALLLATTDKAFAEPKDRIFALLGASSPGTISLDYGLDLRNIYALTAIHCITTQGTFDILFSRWERSYQLNSEVDRSHSWVPDFDRSYDIHSYRQSWQTPCLTRAEQGRWEGARIGTIPDLVGFDHECPGRDDSLSMLSLRDIGIEVIENTASRCRLAFNGVCVKTVSQLFQFGQQNLDCILADLSGSTESVCEGNGYWKASTTNLQERHAYDICDLLLKSCSLHLECSVPLLTDLEFQAQRQRKDSREESWKTSETVHHPKECLEFLAIVDECLRLPWKQCLTGSLASRCYDWTTQRLRRTLNTLLHAVLEYKCWSGTFFITSDGHLGIGPESTQPGDQIVVLDGARSPFVLRPLKNSADYALLGDSFVLGLMHGEVREMDARGELESRKFVIQ